MELFEGHAPSSFPYHGKILLGKLKERRYHSAILPTKLTQLIGERNSNSLLDRGPPLAIIQNPKHIRRTEIMNTCDQQGLKTRLCRPIGYPQGEDSTYGVCSSLSHAREYSIVELNHTCCSRLPRWSVGGSEDPNSQL